MLIVKDWRTSFLNQLQQDLAGSCPAAVFEVERKQEGADYFLGVAWRANGMGAFIKLPPDLPAGSLSLETAFKTMIENIWEHAPIAGNA